MASFLVGAEYSAVYVDLGFCVSMLEFSLRLRMARWAGVHADLLT